MIKHLAAFVFIFCSTLLTAFGQDNTQEKIQRYLSDLEQVGFMGSVMVVRNGDVLVSKGYGFADVEKQIKNSPTTAFDIGSLTKQFTAAAILALEQDGKLSTGDSLSKYFNNIPDDKKSITVHDLLRHQSGLVSNVGKDFEKITEQEFLKKVFSSKLLFPVGTDFSYSNVGYSLLAMIVEKVSNQTYETYLYEHLWKPAQMESTGYSRPAFDKSRIAVGYDRDGKRWGKPNEKEWNGAAPYLHLKGNGGVLSTTEDLHKWHNALVGNRILSEAAKQKMYQPRLRPHEDSTLYYAYGWDVSRTTRNTQQVWHNGTNRIFYADFLRLLDDSVVVIFFSNKSNQNFNNASFEIARIIFNANFSPEIPISETDENVRFTSDIIKTLEDQGIEQAKVDYEKRKSTQKLLEHKMRDNGFDLIDGGKPELALLVFEMNAFAHPQSAKALQGLAEGYMETGKNELAIKYFEESLKLNPDNRFVIEMIKKLQE